MITSRNPDSSGGVGAVKVCKRIVSHRQRDCGCASGCQQWMYDVPFVCLDIGDENGDENGDESGDGDGDGDENDNNSG